jgi:hypothetical protein
MKTLLTIILAALMAVSVAAQDVGVWNDHNYVPNAMLPFDIVQLADEDVINDGDFYQAHPKTRPVNVPSPFVLVEVYQHREYSGTGLVFVGFIYLDADKVNILHGKSGNL